MVSFHKLEHLRIGPFVQDISCTVLYTSDLYHQNQINKIYTYFKVLLWLLRLCITVPSLYICIIILHCPKESLTHHCQFLQETRAVIYHPNCSCCIFTTAYTLFLFIQLIVQHCTSLFILFSLYQCHIIILVYRRA